MKREKQKYIIMLMITMLSLTYGIKNISKTKYEELPEVKLKEKIEKEKTFAIMVQNEDGNGYSEYQENSWPGSGYKYKEAKCTDNKGEIVENAISFESGKATITTDKTIYCTLYFDNLFNGKGTKDNPYKINFIEDLVDLQVAVNNGESYAGEYFTLEKNLDFNVESDYKNYQSEEYGDINGNSREEDIKVELTTGSGWIPIGSNEENSFQGNFNGNEKAINNIYILNSLSNKPLGFFGYIEKSTITNLTIQGNMRTTIATNIGGIVGTVVTKATIDSCHSEINVDSDNYWVSLGGIVGANTGDLIIRKTDYKGKINSNESSLGTNVGGILGFNAIHANVKVTDSANYGIISDVYHGGGIIGHSVGIATIENCENNGQINPNSNQTKDSTIGKAIGGIVGLSNVENASEGELTIKNCHNNANLNGINGSTEEKSYCVGGIVGLNTDSELLIENSYNVGALANGNRLGGIIGYVNGRSNVIVNKCYNTGNISVDKSFNIGSEKGGILGLSTNSSTIPYSINILNSYNTGNISEANSIGRGGGLVAAIGDVQNKGNVKILNAYNTGSVIGNSSSNNQAGGLFYYNSENTIFNNIYNIGEARFSLYGSNATAGVLSFKNTYYKNATEVEDNGKIGKLESYIKSENFVTELNNNKSVIDLNSIDNKLTNFKLCSWKYSVNGPILDYTNC